MTPEQIGLVQQSFSMIGPKADAVSARFYETLFAMDPTTAAMFSGADLEAQGRKLMTALAVVVSGLTRADDILPVIRMLGVRHGGYGVTESHYNVVGEALIDTLEASLGAAFEPAARDAWLAAYSLISGTMIEASRGVPMEGAHQVIAAE